MPHRGQIRPLLGRRTTTLLLPSLFALGCAPSGKVVVVLDSTMRAESVEVVVVPDNGPSAASTLGKSRSGDPSGPHSAQILALDDSAARLEARFRAMRDSVNADVASLDTADRRSRSYSVKYAEIRRRTLAAEHARARRDSMQARGVALRLAAGIDTSAASVTAPARTGDPARTTPSVQRHTVRDSTITLSLAPGRWSIGAARAGALPTTSRSVTVTRGSTDTLRLTTTR